MTVLTPKRPGEVVRYVFDLLKELGDDIIATFTLEVTSGTVVITDAPTPPVNLGEGVTATIGGGANGETATLTLTVNTEGGQTVIHEYTLGVTDGVQAIVPSTVTKDFICKRAFEAMGMSPYEFDPTPEEYRSALDNLDALMVQLANNDLDLGYNFPPTLGGGNLTDESQIPDFAVQFIGLRLAQRLAPFIGKTLSRETLIELRLSESAVRARCAVIPDRPLPAKTPLGAGQKPWSTWWPFSGNVGGSSG